MRHVDLILSQLSGVKRNSRGWTARCPAHDDRTPSLSIAEGDDGRALLWCHAGCTIKAVASALGLAMRDLMPGSGGSNPATGRQHKPPAKTYATAHEAVAALERRHGPRSAWWTYHNAKGNPVGVMVRWDGPNGKTLRPVSLHGSTWRVTGMPTPRPLYGLPALVEAKRVYVAEGEKSAEAVRSIGLTATTSAHGSKSAAKSAWSVLAGKQVVILPDNDDAGRRYASDVVEALAKLSPAPTVKLVELPDLPAGGDAVEYTEARRAAGLDDAAIRGEIEALADAAEPSELTRPPPKIVLFRSFPVGVLPEPVRSFVVKGAKAIGCDPSYIALPLLSALASAIGNTRRIRLKRSWSEPPILWTVIVGESGSMKTPAFRMAMKPVRDRQNAAMKDYAEATKDYEVEALRYEKDLAAWRRAKGDCDPPEKPERPEAERYVVSDTTVEALAPILLANPRGVLLACDELSGWIGSFDRYAGGKGGDVAHWLSMHGGESIIVDRKTGQQRTIHVPSASVCLTGGIQPGTLRRALGCEHWENGLAPRLLLAYPSRRPKRWTEATIPASTEAAVGEVFERLYKLEPDLDDNGDLRPRVTGMTPAGKRAWIEFHDEHAEEQTDLTGDLAACWSKLEGYAARFALVFHLVRSAADDPTLSDPDVVDELSMMAGVTLSRWFGREARRVYAVLGESTEDREQRRLIELVQRRGGSVTTRDLMRSSRRFPSSSDAEAALNGLAEAGIGRWELEAPGPKGGKPSKRFKLVDTVDVDDTPAGATENGGFVNVNAVDTGDDTTDHGCHVSEEPPDEIRFSGAPEAQGVAPVDVDNTLPESVTGGFVNVNTGDSPQVQGPADDGWGEP